VCCRVVVSRAGWSGFSNYRQFNFGLRDPMYLFLPCTHIRKTPYLRANHVYLNNIRHSFLKGRISKEWCKLWAHGMGQQHDKVCDCMLIKAIWNHTYILTMVISQRRRPQKLQPRCGRIQTTHPRRQT
jgi:hypothetical protein